MDLALVKVEKDYNNDFTITFSGAKRPMFYFQNNENKLNELKADRISIGGMHYADSHISFTDQIVTLKKDDLIYLSTDGYIDQNNPERKRMGTNTLMMIVEEVHSMPMEHQKNVLHKVLKEWMKAEPQRDDITVMGIKLI
jgi:serine phosphatase RsbU (regulator of sigma subunit)